MHIQFKNEHTDTCLTVNMQIQGGKVDVIKARMTEIQRIL